MVCALVALDDGDLENVLLRVHLVGVAVIGGDDLAGDHADDGARTHIAEIRLRQARDMEGVVRALIEILLDLRLGEVAQIAVIERHKNTHHIGLGYIQGYGLKSGAVATSISHDSHNIIVVGTNAQDMAFAANRIVDNHGGIVVVENGEVKSELVLELAGIMSDSPLIEVNEKLEAAKDAAHKLGVNHGIDPFMTLSFMALPVIPTLRITTRGIIDVVTQQYI